ncbi:hypothetical protein DQ384_05185 [Sphaerisporangium album]|uniref:Uncharacterized protein n=1 Tax=Sphaerisporangium album TaxID=509200 RepID=A0A367FNI9_9ACTN|nr:hypothetical protein DQ384_05185 [Sphaerisporangium album]
MPCESRPFQRNRGRPPIARRPGLILTPALGRAPSWQQTPLELLENGLYDRFQQLLVVPYEPPDMAAVARMRAEREASE